MRRTDFEGRAHSLGSLPRTLGFCLALLVLPAIALSRWAGQVDGRLLVALPLAASILSFLAYGTDKHRAKAGAWRIPESSLHLIDFLGGWPGGFLAQQGFRHKTAKPSFQLWFWATVLLYQLLALDCLLGWTILGRAIQALRFSAP